MPVIVTTPYDNAEAVLNLTRSILNDAAQSIAGNLFADANPYTFVLLNSAYRTLQDQLVDSGAEVFTKEIQLQGLAAVAVIDPATRANVSFTGYNNGTSNFATPLLPADLIVPLRLWERQSGTTSPFCEMRPTNDGLPQLTQTSYLRFWDWRGDAIWMLGSLQTQDLNLRYASYLPDLLDGTSLVLILRSLNALAYLTAAEFAAARGSPLADAFRQQADTFIAQMTSRTSRKKQRGQHRRRGYGMARGF